MYVHTQAWFQSSTNHTRVLNSPPSRCQYMHWLELNQAKQLLFLKSKAFSDWNCLLTDQREISQFFNHWEIMRDCSINLSLIQYWIMPNMVLRSFKLGGVWEERDYLGIKRGKHLWGRFLEGRISGQSAGRPTNVSDTHNWAHGSRIFRGISRLDFSFNFLLLLPLLMLH